MTNWKMVRLEDIAANEKSSISKPYGSAILRDDYRADGIPVVRGINLASGIFHDDDFVFIDPRLASKMPGAEMKSGDLVVTHRGTVGQVSMIPREARYQKYVASTSQVKVRLNPAVAVPEYYYYWFASPVGRQTILERASTVGVPGIAQPVSTIKTLLVPQPSLNEQRSTVELLSSIDNKILANYTTLTLCEDLADALFAHAVVGLEFSQNTFQDVAHIGGGGTPKTSVTEYWNGTISWATPTDVTGSTGPYLFRTERSITKAGLNACASPVYPVNSIMMTSRATIGAFAIAQSPTAVNQGFIVLNAKLPEYQLWLYHEMKSRIPEFISYANGAVFLELPRGRFKQLRVRYPSLCAAQAFDDKVRPIHEYAAQLTVENERLAFVRDELLPLLMSGKVRVRDAEKVVEEVL